MLLFSNRYGFYKKHIADGWCGIDIKSDPIRSDRQRKGIKREAASGGNADEKERPEVKKRKVSKKKLQTDVFDFSDDVQPSTSGVKVTRTRKGSSSAKKAKSKDGRRNSTTSKKSDNNSITESNDLSDQGSSKSKDKVTKSGKGSLKIKKSAGEYIPKSPEISYETPGESRNSVDSREENSTSKISGTKDINSDDSQQEDSTLNISEAKDIDSNDKLNDSLLSELSDQLTIPHFDSDSEHSDNGDDVPIFNSPQSASTPCEKSIKKGPPKILNTTLRKSANKKLGGSPQKSTTKSAHRKSLDFSEEKGLHDPNKNMQSVSETENVSETKENEREEVIDKGSEMQEEAVDINMETNEEHREVSREATDSNGCDIKEIGEGVSTEAGAITNEDRNESDKDDNDDSRMNASKSDDSSPKVKTQSHTPQKEKNRKRARKSQENSVSPSKNGISSSVNGESDSQPSMAVVEKSRALEPLTALDNSQLFARSVRYTKVYSAKKKSKSGWKSSMETTDEMTESPSMDTCENLNNRRTEIAMDENVDPSNTQSGELSESSEKQGISEIENLPMSTNGNELPESTQVESPENSDTGTKNSPECTENNQNEHSDNFSNEKMEISGNIDRALQPEVSQSDSDSQSNTAEGSISENTASGSENVMETAPAFCTPDMKSSVGNNLTKSGSESGPVSRKSSKPCSKVKRTGEQNSDTKMTRGRVLFLNDDSKIGTRSRSLPGSSIDYSPARNASMSKTKSVKSKSRTPKSESKVEAVKGKGKMSKSWMRIKFETPLGSKRDASLSRKRSKSGTSGIYGLCHAKRCLMA